MRRLLPLIALVSTACTAGAKGGATGAVRDADTAHGGQGNEAGHPYAGTFAATLDLEVEGETGDGLCSEALDVTIDHGGNIDASGTCDLPDYGRPALVLQGRLRDDATLDAELLVDTAPYGVIPCLFVGSFHGADAFSGVCRGRLELGDTQVDLRGSIEATR